MSTTESVVPPYYSLTIVCCRLEGVEARLQETAEAFEQSRQLAKKTKQEFERVKKQRWVEVATCSQKL